MSKLLPKTSVLTLSTNENLSIRPLTAFEVLSHARMLAEKIKGLEGDIDVVSLLLDVATTHQPELAKIIAVSCTKSVEWVTALTLEDMLAIAAEIVAVNISAQKKTPALLTQLVNRLNMS